MRHRLEGIGRLEGCEVGMGFGSLLRKRLMGWEYMWFDVVVGNSTGHEEVGPRLVMVLKGDHDDGWVTRTMMCALLWRFVLESRSTFLCLVCCI